MTKDLSTLEYRVDTNKYLIPEAKKEVDPKKLPNKKVVLPEGEKPLEPYIQALIDAEKEVIRQDSIQNEINLNQNT